MGKTRLRPIKTKEEKKMLKAKYNIGNKLTQKKTGAILTITNIGYLNDGYASMTKTQKVTNPEDNWIIYTVDFSGGKLDISQAKLLAMQLEILK